MSVYSNTNATSYSGFGHRAAPPRGADFLRKLWHNHRASSFQEMLSAFIARAEMVAEKAGVSVFICVAGPPAISAASRRSIRDIQVEKGLVAKALRRIGRQPASGADRRSCRRPPARARSDRIVDRECFSGRYGANPPLGMVFSGRRRNGLETHGVAFHRRPCVVNVSPPQAEIGQDGDALEDRL